MKKFNQMDTTYVILHKCYCRVICSLSNSVKMIGLGRKKDGT